MTLSTLSYPTSMRGAGTGLGQAVLRVGSTISLLWFPSLKSDLGTRVYFAVAVAPLLGLLVLLAIREPVGAHVDAEGTEQPDEHGTAARRPRSRRTAGVRMSASEEF